MDNVQCGSGLLYSSLSVGGGVSKTLLEVSKTLEVETRVVVVAGLVVGRLVIGRLVVAMVVVGLVVRSVPATEPARD